MNHVELDQTVSGMLGFRVKERDNDAILERLPDGNGKIAVRPATREEVLMYVRLLGLSARTQELTTSIETVKRLAAQSVQDADAELKRMDNAIQMMGEQLQSANARILELMAANKGLGEEREFLAEVHRERIKFMQAKHDAGLIAAAERMQEEWLKRFEEKEAEFTRMEKAWRGSCEDLRSELRNAYSKLEHAEEQRDAAHDAANDMHAELSDAEERIRELKVESANLNEVIRIAEAATCDVHGNEEGKS